MIEINLVPDVKQEFIRAQRVRAQVISWSIFVGVIAVGAVVLLAVYVFGVQFGRSIYADSQIDNGYKTLSKTTDLSKLLTVQNQLTKITELHSASPETSRIFDTLTSVIPPAPNDIQISDLVVDTSLNNFTFTGVAPSGYAALETFKKTLSNSVVEYTPATDGSNQSSSSQTVPLASDISISDVHYGLDANNNRVLTFSMGFTFAPELFDNTLSNVHIVIKDIGNNTDSYIGVPKSLFTQTPTSTGGQ
jgi:Flp pilus assembly protein TadG